MKKLIINIIILVQVVGISTFCNTKGTSKNYYISNNGNDSNSGTSMKAPWKTIEKVNSVVFNPGDAILFESGGIWKGQLHPQGDGEKGNPVTLSTYGKGSMPVINMGDSAGTAIRLSNQSWWNILGIEITSGAQPQSGIKREAISVTVEKGKKIEGIVIKDCYIHDVWGQIGGPATSRMINIGPVVSREYDAVNDILIENNKIERCDKVGIVVIGRNNILVRGNYIENLGGDGIIVAGANKGLIEKNIADRTCLRSGDPDIAEGKTWWPHTAAIWLAGCTETIMQFNEVYNTGRQPGNGDGFAYDFDYGCNKCILQYNYSANGHGLLLIMNRAYDNIARYNISQNDQTHLVQIHGNTEDRNIIHNNIFYVDHSTVDIDYYCGMEDEKDKTKLGATFKNNIFYASSQARFRTVYTHGSALERKYNDSLKIDTSAGGPVFSNNCYFGQWLKGLPDDPGKLIADPMFVAPGTGDVGLSTLGGYKLRNQSQCINKGVMINKDLIRDFFGNLVKDEAPDIGVFEFVPVSVKQRTE